MKHVCFGSSQFGDSDLTKFFATLSFFDFQAYFDRNKDGRVSYPEFVAFFKSESHAAAALRSGKGKSAGEKAFARKTRDIESALRDKLRRLRVGPSLRRQFRRFDRTGGGTLTRREFARAVQALGMDLARRTTNLLQIATASKLRPAPQNHA